MGSVPRPGDVYARLERAERMIEALQRQSTLTSASIGSGGLTVRNGGVIKSGDYVEGESGWQIGQDRAEFNTLQVRNGDLQSGDYVPDTSGWKISNDEAEFNRLKVRNGIIGVDALNRQVETTTASSSGNGNVTSRTQSVTITVPTWAQTISVMAVGTSGATFSPIGLTSYIIISGDQGPETSGGSDTAVTIPAAHARTFDRPGNTFVVSLFTGVQGTTARTVFQTVSVVATFVRTS